MIIMMIFYNIPISVKIIIQQQKHRPKLLYTKFNDILKQSDGIPNIRSKPEPNFPYK